MDIIKYEHQSNVYTSKLFDKYYKDLKIGVFDIETMGLNPSYSEVILVGIMEVLSDGKCIITQYFAENKSEEPELLAALDEEFKKYDYVLTYNGKHFDIPFIEKRFVKNGLKPCRTLPHNLDLYLLLNGHSELKKILPNMKQKSVEEYMGFKIDRKDEISGADSVKMYEAFVSETDENIKADLKEKILLHNHDDLLQLYQLMPIIQKTNFHRGMSYLGFPVKGSNGWPQLNTGKVRVDTKGVHITGTYRGETFSYMSYEGFNTHYSCSFEEDGTFSFLLPVERVKGSIFVALGQFIENPDTLSVLSAFPGHVNGYLILCENNLASFMELNMFIKAFLSEFMDKTNCPL